MKVPDQDLYGEGSCVPRLLRTPAPFPDESLMGYILRLTEENGYDTVSWIFNLAGLKANSGCGGWFDFYSPDFDPAMLEQVLGLTRSEFNALKYGNGPSRRSVVLSDQPIPVDFIRFSAPKVCPECLRQENYYRRIWDLLPLTACPDHGLILIDSCPGCSRRISWSRKNVSVCRCGFDWRTSQPVEASADGLEASRHVQRLYRQSDEILQTQIDGNPLYGLGLDDLCRALTLLAGYQLFIEEGGWIKTKTENQKCHEAYSCAFRAFTAWPTSFYRFLLWVRRRGGRWISESKLYRRIEVQCDTSALRFMYIACEDYVEACEWRASELGLTRPPSFRRFVDRDEACRRLGIDQKCLDPLIEKGKLMTILHPTRHCVLIDAESIELLHMSLCGWWSLAKVADLLGTEAADAEDLVHEGFLKPLSGPTVDGLPEWRFNSSDLIDLIDRIGDRVADGSTVPWDNLMAVRAAIRQLKACGFGPGRCMRAILEGEVVALRGQLLYPHIPYFVLVEDCVPRLDQVRATQREYVKSLYGDGAQTQPFNYKVWALALKERRNKNLREHSRRTRRKIFPGVMSLQASDLARVAREVFSRTLS